MEVIGRIGNRVYLHLSHERVISTATLSNSSDLEYIDEYSSMYFIELAVYGISQFEETEPVTKCDKLVYSQRITYDT